MKLKFSLLILLTAFAFTACETDALVELPPEEEKIVVFSFLNPDSSRQEINITKSVPVFGNNGTGSFVTVRNAVVKLSVDSTEFMIPFDNSTETYSFDQTTLDITFNKTYQLKVSVDGKEVYSSTQTIGSELVSIGNCTLDSNFFTDAFGYRNGSYLVQVNWVDPSAEKNYYRVSMNALYRYPFGSDTLELQENLLYNNALVSDEGKNGQSLKARLEYFIYGSTTDDGGIVGFKVYLHKIDEAQYRYLKALTTYAGDDPFSEPSILFSNVENGLGIFGSYQETSKTVFID